MLKYLLALFCTLLATLTAAGMWLALVYPNRPGPGSGQKLELTLPVGSSARQVAEILETHGVVGNARIFALYARLVGADRRFRAGFVPVRDNLSVSELIQCITRTSGTKQTRVTIPEGLSRFEIAKLLESQGLCQASQFLQTSIDRALMTELGIAAPSLEGYLFPDTYVFSDRDDARAITRRFVDNFQHHAGRLLDKNSPEMKRLSETLGWNQFQVLTLASIVEKEAAVAPERPIIAGVFLNRLTKADFQPKRLQADPTVVYGCLVAPDKAPSCNGYKNKQITRQMLDDPGNIYNTYRYDGLPPGPISNPGLSAISAVLNPEKHAYLYFVAKDDGRHQFSATLEAHHRAVRSR